MKMQIDIYQNSGGNMHVVLHRRAGSEAGPGHFDVFARYVEICQAFAGLQATQPEDLTADSKANSWFFTASPVVC